MDNEGFQSYDSLNVSSKSNGNGNVPLPHDPGPGLDQNPPQSDGTVHMKREIGLVGGIAMIVGNMIGSGIFISPTRVFIRSGDSVATSLIVWIGCGLLSTLSAITYCELGTVVPRSGGEHAYLMDAFGPLHPFWGQIPAFQFAWMKSTVLKPSVLAILSLSFAEYIILPIMSTQGISKDWTEELDYDLASKFIAVVCVCIVATVNIVSTKLSNEVQIVFTFAKLVAAAIIIGVGIYNLSIGEFGSLPTGGFDRMSDGTGYGDIALAFYSGLWSYDGWNNLNFLTEELINPNRNLPLAIFIGIPLATALYLFMNVSYFTVLSKVEFKESAAVGIELGDRILGGASFIIPVLVALSVFGAANGSLYTAGRISYVAGRDGHLPGILSYVHHKRLTPAIAIFLNTSISIILIVFKDINNLIDTFSVVSWIFYALALVAFFILRHRKPDAVRPFRVPVLIPAVALVASVYLVVAPIIDKPTYEHLYPLGFCALGLLFYYPFVYQKKEFGCMNKITRYIQLITLVAPSPYKAD